MQQFAIRWLYDGEVTKPHVKVVHKAKTNWNLKQMYIFNLWKLLINNKLMYEYLRIKKWKPQHR